MLVTSLCCHEAMNPPRVVQTAIPGYPCCCFYSQSGPDSLNAGLASAIFSH